MKKIFKFSLTKTPFQREKKYKIKWGNYSIVSLETGLITQKHLENIRRKLSKQFKKISTISKFKIFIRCCVWKPYTAKPLLSRMGKGAGNISNWIAWINVGYILIDILTTKPQGFVVKIFKRAIKLFPLKLVLIQNNL